MKKCYFLFLWVATCFMACSNYSRNVPFSDMQETAPFHHVSVNGRRTHMRIALVQTTDIYQIGVSSRHKDSLSWSITNDTLHIQVPKGVHYSYAVMLCSPEFRSIDASLVQTLYTPDTLHQDTLMVEANLVEQLHLNMHVSQLRTLHRVNKNAHLAGSAEVAYIGNKFADVQLDATRLQTKDLHISMGEGTAKINVSDRLWIHETFNSKILYVGAPKIMECNLKYSILKNALFLIDFAI